MTAITKGMFITLEGIDACGKSYLAHELLLTLRERTQKCSIVNWKENTINSTLLKEAVATYVALAEKMEEKAPSPPLMDLVSAAGFTVLWNERVYSLVLAGATVVSDSWCFKGMARQLVNARLYGYPEGIDNYEEWIFQVHQPATQIDCSFFIDTPVETCWERKKTCTIHETGKSIGMVGPDKNTFLEYQRALRSVLIEFAHKLNWCIIKGSTEEMITAILEVVHRTG